MKLQIPELSLVVLIGPSGCGKSTFARKHFKPTEVISSDFCRGLVSDDENSQQATGDAFDVLKYIAGKRLARGLLTVVDATNVQPEARKPMIALAREHDVLPVAIVMRLPEALCHERNKLRPDRSFGPHVVRNQLMQLRRGIRGLEREGFRHVHVLSTPEEVEQVSLERQPLWNNRTSDRGPFDIIGDIHGCFDELTALLEQLGYSIRRDDASAPFGFGVTHPAGRKPVFLGDLVDRGPNVVDVLKLAMSMAQTGSALCIPGNHDVKLLRKLRGRNVQITHGLAQTLEQLASQPPEFLARVEQFLDKLVSHYVLDGGRLVVAHAGLKERYIGRASRRVREFALYGDTTGETDTFGLPVRYNWAAEYRGPAHIVYGHTPVPEADWLNRTINIDTGCVFGGKLSALRWPEMELISVPARQVYAEPGRPFLPAELAPGELSAQQEHDDVLDLGDVRGKRIIATRLHHSITIREENATAALEVMSRFAADPKWLIYLPPTISPTETSDLPGLLEHPRQAFDYYRSEGVGKVVCEEKHMGSRAVAIVCRDPDVARRRFGVREDGAGIIYTRTGRRFFDDRQVERELLEHIRSALSAAGFWEEFASDWFCLDCELMPWSAKAQELLKHQYAAVGSAARASASAVLSALEQAAPRLALESDDAMRNTIGGAIEMQAISASAKDGSESGSGPEVSANAAAGVNEPPDSEKGSARAELSFADVIVRQRERLARVNRYVDAYRQYCWPVNSTADLKLAPFHLLASEKAVHADKTHLWHMQTLARLAHAAPGTPLMATEHRVVDVTQPDEVEAAIAWWQALTARGGEGMVVKPLDFIVRGKRGLMQPAVKCRGHEYLRIIYGPEYDAPENLPRLRRRGLAAKRSLAIREFALGMESLERFVRKEPLRRVHECVFGVLALESEPVDPRL